MRKYLLLSTVMVFVTGFTFAQQAAYVTDKTMQKGKEGNSISAPRTNTPKDPSRQTRASRSLAAAGNLNSQRIASAGNLLTIIDGGCNQLDVNDSLNTVIFIHRNDQSVFPGTNVAQYRFSVSKDGGDNWSSDLGPITNDPVIDNVNVNGRFPQAAIFNPAGNNNPDSAYLVYSGTWHDNNTWSGQMRGRGRLSGDTSTFNVKIDPINNKQVAVATGFCQGVPGVFWNVNRSYTGTFTAGSNALTNSIIIQKGVWNPTTKDVDWTQQVIPQAFTTLQDQSGALFSAIFGLNMAFDPSGQYGWIAAQADVTLDNDSVFDPVFWRTVDGGDNWTGPIRVDLDSLAAVVAQLNPTIINGNPSSGIPSTWTSNDLVVDYQGNPHLLTVIGNGGGYSIQYATFDVWDITFNANPQLCAGPTWNGWGGIYMDSIQTLSGTMTNDGLTEENRPLASRSADGKKLFFFWNESDFELIGAPDNDVPNLFTKAVDLEHFTYTRVTNLTSGDSLWGGETMTTSGGVFGGSIYPTVSPVAQKRGTTYNVPLILTEVDYNHDPSQGLGSSIEPAAFWYISNLDFKAGDFTEGLAADVELNGPELVTIVVGQSYTELGATLTYLDTACYQSGPLQLVIDNSGFDPNTPGTYYIYYTAQDANGNVYAGEIRTIIVGAPPVANFTWSFPQLPYRAQFFDQSTNNPTSRIWDFGNGTPLSSQANPAHTYASNGSYNVCLTATNAFGTSAQVCKLVTITGVGISEAEVESLISIFPNPSNGKVFISADNKLTGDLTVTVYTAIGDLALAPSKYKAGTAIELNLTSFSSGMYLVKIESEKGVAVKSVTINSK